MVKANLYRQNHTKKHTHTQSQKEKKEKLYIYMYIYIYKGREQIYLKKIRKRAAKTINKSTNDNKLEILN